MAEINVNVNRTNDPSYLGNSQGTDRATLQPLATVPELSTKYVTPDYQANKTTGAAIKGVGDIAETAVKLADTIVQKKADDTLSEGIQKIRDEFGVGAATKMAAEDDTKGATLLTDEPKTPVAINRLGNRIEGLTEQFQQGGLSPSAYYAKLEAFVRQTKAQFGDSYNNEIDQMVATKVGTTPANALRGALLNDVTALQAKVQASTDKRTTWEHQNAAALITNFGPQYFSGPKPPMHVAEAAVAKYDANIANVNAERAALGLEEAQRGAKSAQATDFGNRIASNLSQTSVNNLSNNMGIKGTQDLKDYMESVQNGTRKPPTAQEAESLKGVFLTMKNQIETQYHKEMNQPVSKGDTRTPMSIQNDQTKYKAGLEVALSGIRQIEDGLLNDKHGITTWTVALNKAKVDDATRGLLTKNPDAALEAAIPKIWGDGAIVELFKGNPEFGGSVMTSLRNAGWGHQYKGEAAIEFIKTASKDDPNGNASANYVKDATYAIQNPQKVTDPKMVDGAFKSLFGEGNSKLVEAFKTSPGTQTTLFNTLTDKKTVDAIAKRSTGDQQQFTKWAEGSFTSVFQVQAQGINAGYNDAAAKGRIELSYNPKSEKFEYVPKQLTVMEKAADAINGRPPGLPTGAANATLIPINSAFESMKHVLKLNGKTMTEFVGQSLPKLGIAPDSPVWKAYTKATVKDETTK